MWTEQQKLLKAGRSTRCKAGGRGKKTKTEKRGSLSP
jgi:hypothetical protein